jgi:hypothetical protein
MRRFPPIGIREATMTLRHVLIAMCAASVLSACKRENTESSAAPIPTDPATVAADAAPANIHPTVVVYKTESCGCCKLWVEHMQSHGFPVEVTNVDDLGPVKERAGVPYGLGSCHTAEVGGYFIEGHVPATEVQRLLAEKPKARGLTVPGMPMGSPGMEQGGRVEPYQVLLVHEDGSTSVFASY